MRKAALVDRLFEKLRVGVARFGAPYIGSDC
jgi:hypothetical protein